MSTRNQRMICACACACACASALALAAPALAQEEPAADLAKKLANPVASLISVPLQYNHDEYGGINEGASVDKLIIQPVIPFSLNEDWNLISRTLLPIADQQDFPQDQLERIGSRRYHEPLFLFTEGADSRWPGLGCRAGPVAADGDG